MKGRILWISLVMVAAIIGVLGFQAAWLNASYQKGKSQHGKAIRLAVHSALEDERKVTLGSMLEHGIDRSDIHTKLYCQESSLSSSRNSSKQCEKETVIIRCEQGDSVYRESLEWLTAGQVTEMQFLPDPATIDSQALESIISKTFDHVVSVQIDIGLLRERVDKYLNEYNVKTEYTLAFEHEPETINLDQSQNQYIFRVGQGIGILNFPKLKTYLIGQMWLNILGSFILSALVIFSMIYMLRTILMQKNIAEMKNDFISNMTHELKTPISVVSAANEAMQHFNVLEDKEKTNKYLGIARSELDRLALMVDKVLNAAKLDKENLSFNPEPVDIPALLSSIVEKHQLNCPKEIKFSLNAALESDNIKLDRMHFSNVLNNIVDNAVKYSPENVEIQADITEDSKNVLISIADKGRGMTKETVQKLFDKFYREPTGDIHDVKGFGLGLHYVKRIMDHLGGDIKVQSRPGEGSRFTLSIPKI